MKTSTPLAIVTSSSNKARNIEKEIASVEHFWESFPYDSVVPGEPVSVHSEIILMANKAFGGANWKFWGSHEILRESNCQFKEHGKGFEEWELEVKSRMIVERNGKRVDGFAENKFQKVVPAGTDSRQWCKESTFRKADDEALLNALEKFGDVYPTVSQALEGHNLRN
ncbi:hypothetical protein RU639_003172 [Aspergillus parasiticus]